MKEVADKSKKVNAIEELLKNKNQAMTMVKTKSTIFVGLTMIGSFAVLSATYDGLVVGKLPFQPFPMLQNISHRNLPGTDITDCSFAFLYMLCSMSVRTHVQKFLGFAPKSEGMSAMFQPPPDAKSAW